MKPNRTPPMAEASMAKASSIQPREAASKVRRCALVVCEQITEAAHIREIVREEGKGDKGNLLSPTFAHLSRQDHGSPLVISNRVVILSAAKGLLVYCFGTERNLR